MSLLQRSSSMFKEFFLGCLVVGSSLVWKKEKLAEMVTRCHSVSHSLSLVVPLVVPLVVTPCTTRLSFYKRSNKYTNHNLWTLNFGKTYNFLFLCEFTEKTFIKRFTRLYSTLFTTLFIISVFTTLLSLLQH